MSGAKANGPLRISLDPARDDTVILETADGERVLCGVTEGAAGVLGDGVIVVEEDGDQVTLEEGRRAALELGINLPKMAADIRKRIAEHHGACGTCDGNGCVASLWTTRMPRPPPPPEALMITG